MEEFKNVKVETKELTAIVENSGLENTKGQKLLSMFTPYFTAMAEIETKINSLNAENPLAVDVKMAREIRLALKNNRVASEKVKDEQKQSILIEGRLIDNLNNIVKNTSKSLELKCESIEKYAEQQELKRKEERKLIRLEALKPYEELEGFFNLNYDLLNMEDMAFDNLLEGTKLSYEAKKERERKAEELRIENELKEQKERERIKAENEKLKLEAEQREKELAEQKKAQEEERLKAEKLLADEKAKQEAERIKQEKKLADEKKKADEILAKQKEEADKKLKAEQDAKLKLEKELKAKQEAEQKAKEEADKKKKKEAEEQKKLARQPDKQKLELFSKSVLNVEYPDVKSEEAKKILTDVQSLMNKVSLFIKSEIEKL